MHLELVNAETMVKVVSDFGEDVTFELGAYRNARIEKGGDIFRSINEYLKRLKPIDSAAIFGLYLEAKHDFMTATNELALDDKLASFFRRLYAIIDMDDVEKYVGMYSQITIPNDLKSSYEDVDVGYLAAKTYIRPEYMQLLAFVVVIRLAFPIWGEYMSKIESSSTADGKEYHAYGLLRDCKLKLSPAFEKLLAYVDVSTTPSIETSSSTLRGVGRSSIPEWLTGVVIVRKLPVIDLYNTSGHGNIIPAIFSYVDNHLKRLPKKFMDDARERKNEGGGGADDQDQGFIETYRAKQDMSFLQLETAIVYLSTDPVKCCMDIDPSFNPEIMQAVLAISDGLEEQPLFIHNHILTQWVLDGSISTLQPDTIDRSAAVKSMLIAQALCHHWGFHNLALIISGIRVPQKGTMNNFSMKLNPAIVDQLNIIYPYSKPSAKQGANRNKSANYGYLAIVEMSELITNYRYAVRTPQFLTTKDVAVDRYGHLTPPPHISIEIAEMLIKLDKLTPEPVVL